MLSQFFINATILISFIFVGGELTKEKDVSESNLTTKLLYGVSFGLLGTCLMYYTFQVDHYTMVDLRHLAIVLASYLAGGISTVIATIIIVVARLLLFPFSISTIAGIISTIIMGIGCIFIKKFKKSTKRQWIYINIFTLFTSLITLQFLVRDVSFIIYCGILAAFASIIVFISVRYVQQSNEIFRIFKQEASKDHLTGLKNARQFEVIYKTIVGEVNHSERTLSLLMIDIDFFKKVNDTYGHSSGDQVLKELAKLLTNSCRQTDIVSRNGGEEFSILLPDCPYQTAILIAERVRKSVEEHLFPIGKESIHITISIGVANYPRTINNANELLVQSDVALYKAKNNGRNRVCSIETEG